MAFNKIKPGEIKDNVFKLIGDDWMLITAGNNEKINTMTASWGGMGILWQKYVAFCFVRPTRYTYEFMENNDYYSLSFFAPQHRVKLVICGTNSGRDMDKIKAAKLTPAYAECGAPYFEEADMVLVCHKIYEDDIKPEKFLDPSLEESYPDKDYHKAYVGEIVEILKK